MDNENMNDEQEKSTLEDHVELMFKELVNSRNQLNEHGEWIQDHYFLHELLNNFVKNETKIDENNTKINENNIVLMGDLKKKMYSLKKINYLIMVILIIHIVLTYILFAI